MASEKRQSDPSLKRELLDEFYSFSFFKAVQLLESLFPEKKAVGETLTPEEECVRFSVQPGFSFPPSDIYKLEAGDGGSPVEMGIKFMGLIGPSGVLPYWYNELAIERVRNKDTVLIDFLNMFHHRLISFFYLGWKKQRLPANYLPGARDRLSRQLLSFIGLGTPELAERIDLPAEPLIFYSGHLSRAAPSATAIEAAVEYLAETRARVEQFVERLVPLELEDQTQLGSANARLGHDAVCGGFAWECRTKFRVNLGPMLYREFVSLLPSGRSLPSVFSLLRTLCGMEYEFDVCLILKRREVPPCVLGVTEEAAPRLGWSTWLTSSGSEMSEDPRVVFYRA